VDFTDEFQWFAFITLYAFEKGFSSDEEFRELVFERLDGAARKRLLDFLNSILDGRYDDRQLEELWSKTDTDWAFFRPGDTRRYLTAIRNELANELGHQRR
jgi:hypothetical protein